MWKYSTFNNTYHESLKRTKWKINALVERGRGNSNHWCKNYESIHKNGLEKYLQYGPVVKEEIVSGLPIIWIFDPKDIMAMYKAEGKYPSRRSHLALDHYRRGLS